MRTRRVLQLPGTIRQPTHSLPCPLLGVSDVGDCGGLCQNVFFPLQRRSDITRSSVRICESLLGQPEYVLACYVQPPQVSTLSRCLKKHVPWSFSMYLAP